jgi:outer membrane protein assembly factor BamA
MNPTAARGLVLGAVLLAVAARGAAQEQAQPSAQPSAQPAAQAPGQESVEPAKPTKDLFDLLREMLHKPPPPPPGPEDYKKWMIAAAPVITYGPTSGFGIGVAGNMAVYRGFPETTRISSIVASVTATTKSQVLVNAKVNSSTVDNRRHFEGDNRLYWTSQKTYGLGTSTTEDAAVDQKYDYFRFYETQYFRVVQHTFLGAGFLYSNHQNVRPGADAEAAWESSPYVLYSEEHGFDPRAQTSAGGSLSVLFEGRDDPINPSRGVYANLTYRAFFKGFLGGASNWQELSYDGRTYLRLTPDARHKLAFWLMGDFVVAGTPPYLDLPATGMDTYGRTGRGYPQGRFRGQELVYGEVEYRWTVTKNGLFGMVAFLNTETLSNKETGEKLFDSFATGGGFGFRLMLNKRSLTNLCLDLGLGQDGSKAVYFAVQEAF